MNFNRADCLVQSSAGETFMSRTSAMCQRRSKIRLPADGFNALRQSGRTCNVNSGFPHFR